MAAEKPPRCGCGVCEFGPDFESYKPWLRANAPGVYPDELIAPSSSSGGDNKDVDKVGERLQGVGISDGSTSAAGARSPTEKNRDRSNSDGPVFNSGPSKENIRREVPKHWCDMHGPIT